MLFSIIPWIDEFALRKGHHYDTVLCDLQNREVLEVCSGRTKEEVVHHFRCPSCKRKLKYFARQVGHKGMCGSCREHFVFPTPLSTSSFSRAATASTRTGRRYFGQKITWYWQLYTMLWSVWCGFGPWRSSIPSV